MNIAAAKIYGVIIGILGIIGLFVSGHLFQIMNTDWPMDVLRLVLAAYLLYAAFIAKSERLSSGGLLVLGIVYIILGIWALFSSTLGGILAAGMTGFDVAFHLITGVIAASIAMTHREARHGREAHV